MKIPTVLRQNSPALLSYDSNVSFRKDLFSYSGIKAVCHAYEWYVNKIYPVAAAWLSWRLPLHNCKLPCGHFVPLKFPLWFFTMPPGLFAAWSERVAVSEFLRFIILSITNSRDGTFKWGFEENVRRRLSHKRVLISSYFREGKTFLKSHAASCWMLALILFLILSVRFEWNVKI